LFKSFTAKKFNRFKFFTIIFVQEKGCQAKAALLSNIKLFQNVQPAGSYLSLKPAVLVPLQVQAPSAVRVRSKVEPFKPELELRSKVMVNAPAQYRQQPK
jgi:hypothetical protein